MRASLLVAAIAPFAFAAPALVERATSPGATRIVNAVNAIQSNIAILTTDLNGFNKGDLDALPKVLAIQQQTKTLGESINNATAAANAAKKQNDADSGTIAVAVLNLQDKIGPLLQLIVKKKPAFDSAVLGVGSVSPQVLKSLKEQKAQSDAFGAALTKKLSKTFADLAPGIIKQIDSKFDAAIKAYSTSGGLFPVPPLPFKA